jgi:hypothetical protein
MKVTQLRVYANCYAQVHRLQGKSDGFTWAGLCPLYSDGVAGVHGQHPRYVGASLDTENTAQLTKEASLTVKGITAVTSFAQHDLAYKYDTEPTTIPIAANDPDCLAYYRSMVFSNDLTGHSSLVAADLDTARACGISKDQYKDPLVLLEELRTKAIERFAASNSDITVEELDTLLPHVFTAQKAKKTSTTPSQATSGGNS